MHILKVIKIGKNIHNQSSHIGKESEHSTWVLGNMKFISHVEQDISLVRFAYSWDILFNTWNKFHISVQRCNHVIFYIYLSIMVENSNNGHWGECLRMHGGRQWEVSIMQKIVHSDLAKWDVVKFCCDALSN